MTEKLSEGFSKENMIFIKKLFGTPRKKKKYIHVYDKVQKWLRQQQVSCPVVPVSTC